MLKKLLRLCSMLLIIAMLANMLPAQVLGQAYRDSLAASPEQETEPATAQTTNSEIVEEIIENRTEFTKEFKLSGGMHMAAVYPTAVHYETDSGWEEIDNTLKINTNGTYTNTAGVWEVSFPQSLSGSKHISITKDGHTLSFAMAGELRSSGELMTASINAAETFAVSAAQTATAQVQRVENTALKASAQYPQIAPDKLHSRLTYSDVYQNTNVLYDLESNQVKESIVLESYSSTLRGYRYTLNVGQMIPVLEESGQILFYTPDRKDIVMVMPAPFMVDAAMEYNYDVQVQLTGSGSTYTLTYLLPRQWLAESSRAWPVVLDPIVSASIAATNMLDRRISENVTFAHDHHLLEAGRDNTYGKTRSYLQYVELPPLTSADVVVGAAIQLYQPTVRTDPSMQLCVEVRQVNAPWDSQTITWANQPAYDTNIEDYCMVVGTPGYYAWNITDIVRSWYADGNYGLVFKSTDENEASTGENWMQFYSSDAGGYSKPILSVMFRNNNGLEGYWDYTATSAGRAGTGYVNNFTGNLVWVHGDMGFGGNRMPVSISHVYNANDSQNNAFGMGWGWRTNFNQLVYQWNTDNRYYVWEDADGTDHYFIADGEGVLRDEDGLELTLAVESDGFTLTDKYDNTSHFDGNGRLVKQQNNQASESSINITYTTSTGKLISTITDGAGRLYTFSYENDLLQSIQYWGTDHTKSNLVYYVNFWYDNDGHLLWIEDVDGGNSGFTYTTKDLLATAQYSDGHKLTFNYNTTAYGKPSRVTGIAEHHYSTAGGTLAIEYAHNQTTFKDHNNNVEIHQFNDFGNTISIQDDEGRAQYSQFSLNTKAESDQNTDAKKKHNQLALSSKLQNTVGNYLINPSFENGHNWLVNAPSSVSISCTTEQAYLGSHSLKAISTGVGEIIGTYSPQFYVQPGETITISAYVKNPDAPAYIAIHHNNNVDFYNIFGETLPASNDWVRTQVTYTNPMDYAIKTYVYLFTPTPGTYYIDCVQVERTNTASRYNLVDNGDFRHGTDNWLLTNLTGTDGVVSQSSAAPELDSNVLQFTGTPGNIKHLYQQIHTSGNAGDTYVLAGWAKGDSVPFMEGSSRDFSLVCIFHNTDGSYTERAVRFNPDTDSTNAWQYAAGAVVADKAYHTLYVDIRYDYNANTVYFDGIQLYKEEFGNSYTYDENGNLKSVVDLQKQVTSYEYTGNDLTKEILPTGVELNYTYDNRHNVISATTNEGLTYNFTYDGWGNNTSVSIAGDGKTMSSSAVYTTDGNRLVSVTDAAGKTTTYSYNADTNLLEWVQYPEDTEETRTHYEYDPANYLTSVDAYAGGMDLLKADYTYYGYGLLESISTYSTTYYFNYGVFNQISAIQVGDRTLASYSYTNDRNHYLSRLDYGNNDHVQYTYDDKGRVLTETYEDGATVTYTYDNSGSLAKVTDSATGRTTSYYYDFTDRTMKYVESGTDYSHSVGYEYDVKNNLTGQTESINGVSKTTSYTYDEDNRLETVTDGTSTRVYTYDAFGRLTQRVTKQGETVILTETFTYVSPTATTTTGQIATHRTVAAGYDVTYTYTYDDNGNIATISDGTNTTSYYYDAQNRMEREQKATSRWFYSYEEGNIYERHEQIRVDGEWYSNEIVSYVYGDDAWGDLLTGRQIYNSDFYLVENQTITSDTIGNMLTDGTWTYTWKHGRQLATMSDGSTTWTFTYDADGMRTKKTNGTQTYTYVYNGGQLSQMTKGTDTLRFSYDASGLPLTLTYNGTTYYYITNIQGDVIGITNQSGQMVVQYLYNAWGVHLETTGTMASTLGQLNPLRYRGYVYDTETELYYVSSRYYDPEIGRFINADDIDYLGADGSPLSYNLFAYCMNNPVNRFDVNGNWSLPNWAKVVIGAVATVAAVAVTVATGGAAAPVLIAVAASTIGGAAVSAVNHRVTTGSWEGADKAALDGAVDGFMTGGLCALGGSVVGGAARTIKNAKSGITIGKTGQFEKVAELAKTRHYSGLKEFNFIKKVAGQKAAETVGWWQNKCVVKGVMALKGAIYDCGGALTGAYAKEVALTKGYQYLYNVWLM